MRQFKISERFTHRQTRSVSLYINEMQKNPVLAAEEEYVVACKAFEGDEEARNKLVKANLRFVFTVAKMYSQDPETFNDLVAAGNIGLIDSAKKFDPYKGFKFISYAVWHIRKEMLVHLGKNSRTIRIPGNRNSIAVKAKEARSVIYNKEGREATEEEMLDYIKEHLKNTKHLTVRDMVDILSADRKAWSLDQPLSEHGESESTLLDVYDGTVGSEYSVYDQENYKHIISVLMSDLTPREVEVVERVHAIGDRLFPNSLTEVGISWGMTPEAARLVYRKALKKMQIKARKLKINISSIF